MDEFAEDILHWPSNIYCVSDVSMYYLAKSVLLLITDTPETNCPASNLARLDQLVHDNNGICRMHIIIDIAMD